MQRYHSSLVALHRPMALMVFLSLAAGGGFLANMPPDSAQKLQGLGGHMAFGVAIGVLLTLRLATRLRTRHPPRASTGNEFFDRIGVAIHWGFHMILVGMVATGLATVIGAGLFPIIYLGAADTLSSELSTLPQRAAHGMISKLLLAFIALHIAAAFYHQLVLKDNSRRRMRFGKRL